jgi:putative ABC transport system permease protein
MIDLKIAVRNLLRRPSLNLIKVLVLTLAFTSATLILMFILNQLSYDKFHRNHSRIYRLTITGQNNFDGKHFAKIFDPVFVPGMASYFPEIETYTRLVPVLGGVVKFKDDYIKVEQGYQSDSTFFKVFDCQFRIGSPVNVFNKPGTVVVTESFAHKAFGKADPIGQLITIPAGQYYGVSAEFVVTGVIKDFPQNSHLHPEFLAWPKDHSELGRVAWTYLLLHPHADPMTVTSGFTKFYLSHVNKDTANMRRAYLQNITDIHLRSDKLREIEPNSSISVTYTLAVAGALLLLIAIINFVNLSQGMTVFSDKYLNVTKILGSTRFFVVRYFLSESALLVGAAAITSLVASVFFDIIIVKEFSLHLFDQHWSTLAIIMLLFSSIVIALNTALSQMQSTSEFRAVKLNNRKGKTVITFLIVLQNTISICMIAAVIVIHRQTEYAISSALGNENNDLICFENVHSDLQQKFEAFKSELLKSSSIKSVSAMLDKPSGEANDMMPFTLEGYHRDVAGKDNALIGVLPCDYSITRTFNLTFLSGEDFSSNNNDREGSGEYIINESALRYLHYAKPQEIIGKEFSISFDPSIAIPKGRIIGVVKDFHLSSLRTKVEPLVLFKRKDLWLLNFIVAFRDGAREQALVDIDRVWRRMFSAHVFQYQYVGNMYQNLYKTEQLQKKLLSIFTLVALFVSAMGLLGLCLLNTQRRMKELAIRKVNGAMESQLFGIISWGFIKWVLLACMLAVPVSYYFMTEWLNTFVYKVEISWWVFVLAGTIAILVAFFAIFFQSLRAARANPATILKHE